MKDLVKTLSDYNTFIVEGKLKLGIGVDIPVFTGDSNQTSRIYPGQPVFIVDMVRRVAPFVACKTLSWTQDGDIVTVKAQYCVDDNDYEEVEYKIKCINDVSRCDNINKCTLDVIDMNEIKKAKYIDADQSRYIDNKKYYVTDLFRLGELNKKQRLQLEALFRSVNDNKLHNKASTIYYTDDGECGLWDYLEGKPVKFL